MQLGGAEDRSRQGTGPALRRGAGPIAARIGPGAAKVAAVCASVGYRAETHPAAAGEGALVGVTVQKKGLALRCWAGGGGEKINTQQLHPRHAAEKPTPQLQARENVASSGRNRVSLCGIRRGGRR